MLWDYLSDTVILSTDQASTLENTSTRKKDPALAYFMMSIGNSGKSAVISLRDFVAVWRKLKGLYQAVLDVAVVAKLYKL